MTNEEVGAIGTSTGTRPMAGGRRPIEIILALFLLVGFAYSAINPLHEATDELRHYRFVQHLIQRRSLPVQGEAAGVACTIQGHHPPLYYAAAALVTFWIDTGRDVCYQPPVNPFWAYRYWEVGRDNKNQYLHGPDETFPWRGEALAAHLARVVNLLFGAITVWLTWATARVIWPDRPALTAGSAAFVAFNPMFLYMAAAINNDVVAAAAGAAVVYACVRLLRDERGLSWRWGVALGALYGLALMSKFNLAAIFVVIEAAVTWVAWRRGQWRQWVTVNLLIAGVAALLAGWWFARNQILYGEPTGFEKLTELWGVRDPRDSFWLAVSELPYAWTSLWGRFGYGQIPLPSWIYIALFGIFLLSVAGYGIAGVKGRKEERVKGVLRAALLPGSAAPPLMLLALNVAIFFAVLFNYLLVSPAGPMGRFFFPALSSLAILMFYGLSLLVLTADRKRPTVGAVALVTNLFMFAISLIALFGYLAPAYARPPEYAAGATLPNATDVRFDSFVALRGYAVDTDAARPGEPIGIELYWEVLATPPGDYLLFVHLTDDETGALVAQRDTHPGLGNFPSSQWRPGDRFVERMKMYLPETAYAPSAGELTIGLYAPEGYRLGVTDNATGEGLGDAYPIGRVTINSQAAPDGEGLPNAGDYNFEDRIRLLGYDYDRRVLGVGEPIGLTPYWEALRPSPGNYEVELAVLDNDNNVVFSQTDPLNSADWQPGEVVVGSYTLPTGTTTGDLRVRLVLLDTTIGRRVNRVGDDGRWIDDELFLSTVAVRD
ncbi:MAG TPA: glycosyltransferase family 39 protein [Promineifilum sp.]|nr:glycosyltransferase family 39 protein [Promineifilum sp.]